LIPESSGQLLAIYLLNPRMSIALEKVSLK